MGPAQKVCGTLGRAADAGELGHIFRLDAHLIHGINNALGDGNVAAAGAQGGLAASIIHHGKSNMIGLGPGTGVVVVADIYLASWETIASVTERASIGRPL